MTNDVKVLIVGVIGLLTVRVTHAQIADTYALPRPANCCLLATATTLAEQLQDWNQLGRYHEANQELMKGPVDPGRVVFIGDSITDGYRLDEAFPGKPYVNRGISGQTTAQMLVRFYPDVLALKPAAVVIFAGTNDIARNNGPQTFEMIQHNIMAMTELAQGHAVKVILCARDADQRSHDYSRRWTGRRSDAAAAHPVGAASARGYSEVQCMAEEIRRRERRRVCRLLHGDR